MPHLWKIDSVQFPRLLAEIRAVGLSPEQYMTLASSMDLSVVEIDELLDRAEASWQRIKTRTTHDDS